MPGFIAPILCVFTLTLILLILVAGSNKNVLVDWFFLKVDITALSVPSKLSNSTYLKDLSTVAKVDYVGGNTTAAALGLANSYTISLLSYCAESASGTTCSKPQFGFAFDPLIDLNLGSTSVQTSLPSSFAKTISSYGSASRFLGGAYVLSFLLTLLTPIFAILSACCAPRAIIGGAITSFLATIFLLAASALSVAIFKTVKSAFDSDLGPEGVKTSFGNPLFILTWIATVLSLISTILLCASSRSSKRRVVSRGMIIPSATDKDGSNVGVSSTAGPKPLTLLQRSLTWNKHKYAAIGRKKTPVVKVTGAVEAQEDEDVLLEQRGFGGGEDEDAHEEEEELVRGSTRGIPLTGISGNKPGRDMDTAYEPFRHV